MGDNEYAIGISATGGDQAAGEIDKPANSLKGLSGAHGDLATQLGRGLDTSGFKMVSHEMLANLGLGGQMRAMYPLIHLASNELNTGMLALGGSMATVTMGATLLVGGLVYLYEHMKQNKVVVDDMTKQYDSLKSQIENQIKLDELMANADTMAAMNNYKQIHDVLIPAKNADIKATQQRLDNAKTYHSMTDSDMTRENAVIKQQKFELDQLIISEKMHAKTILDYGAAGEKEATAAEKIQGQKLLGEQHLLAAKKDSADQQIQILQMEQKASLATVSSEERADQNKTHSKQFYANERIKIANDEAKKERDIRDKANKWWVDATAQSAEIVAQAIGQSAFQSNVSWQSASVNIVSALAGATEKMISLTIAADIASMNFVGAAIAAAQYATVEAVKGWATRQIGGDTGSTGSSLASYSASPATSSPATSPSSSGVQATGVQSSAPVNYNQTTNIYAGAFVGDQATMRQFISEIWKQSWVLMNQGQIPKVALA